MQNAQMSREFSKHHVAESLMMMLTSLHHLLYHHLLFHDHLLHHPTPSTLPQCLPPLIPQSAVSSLFFLPSFPPIIHLLPPFIPPSSSSLHSHHSTSLIPQFDCESIRYCLRKLSSNSQLRNNSCRFTTIISSIPQ